MQKNKAIILVGMMGSGKTTTGRELAALLGCDFFDLDEIIEKKYGKISEIFKKQGETYFRDLETQEIKAFSATNFVLSTGGGTVLRDENIELLASLGKIFFLSAEVQTIYERIKNQTHRPLLQTEDPKKTIGQIINARQKQYEKSGEKIITDNKTTKQIAGEIYEKFMR